MTQEDSSYDVPIQIQRPKSDGTQVLVVGASGTLEVDGKLTLPSTPPGSAGATGTAGTITYAAGFLYVCVAANTWQRVAIATF